MHTFNYFPAIIRYQDTGALSLVLTAGDIVAGRAFKVLFTRVRKAKQ